MELKPAPFLVKRYETENSIFKTFEIRTIRLLSLHHDQCTNHLSFFGVAEGEEGRREKEGSLTTLLSNQNLVH
jgi:hypothetical protein